MRKNYKYYTYDIQGCDIISIEHNLKNIPKEMKELEMSFIRMSIISESVNSENYHSISTFLRIIINR